MRSFQFGPILTVLGFLLTIHSAKADSEKPEISFNGFFDAYYSYNFNRPNSVAAPNTSSVAASALPAGNNTYRYYDTYHNQMTLSLVEFSVQAKYREVSLLTDFDFGPFADLNSSTDEVSKHVGQAVISYRPADSRFSFDVGKMYTHVGLETVKSKDNFNYSRTTLFGYGSPFWHTGVRIGYDVVPEKLQTSLYVYNGWNTIYDTNDSKTLGAQIKYTPSSIVSIVYNFIGGPEKANNDGDWKIVHELNTTWGLSESWTLITDALYGSERDVTLGAETKSAKWYAGVVGAKYQLTEKSYLSPRYEIYRDEDGYTLGNIPQTIQSVVFTYGREITSGLQVRGEIRLDKSSENTFVAKSESKDSQVTVLAAMLFTF